MGLPNKYLLIAGLMLATSWAECQATEVCVRCSGPDASYGCVVDSTSTDAAVKLYCITALAQTGPHESCAIDRNAVAPCQGERKELPVPSDFEADDTGPAPGPQHVGKPNEPPHSAPPPPADASKVAPPDTSAENGEKPASTAPPKTVQEMVEKGAQSAGKSVSDANKSAGDTLKKAGSAVGNAAKDTWKCISSLFSDC